MILPSEQQPCMSNCFIRRVANVVKNKREAFAILFCWMFTQFLSFVHFDIASLALPIMNFENSAN